jgi:hypothetical protein
LTVELAAGVAARDLVPGDPDELERLAARLDVLADGMSDAGTKLADVHAAGWVGPAADAFTGLVGEQPAKYRRAGSAFGHAVSAIRGYAAVLRHAQSDAGLAVTRFTDASARSQSWQAAHTRHDADVRAAAAAGEPPPSGPAPPATDPAAGDLTTSRQLLVSAREAVRAQGQIATSALIAATDGAPEEPGLFDSVIGGIGDFVSGAGHVLSSVFHAVGGVLEDVGGFLVDFFEDFGMDLLEIAAGALIMVVGVAVIGIGLSIGAGGGLLIVTGVGAVVGVPAEALAAGVIVLGGIIVIGGAALMMQGGSDFGDDIANRDSDGGGSGRSDGPSRQERLDDLAKDPDRGGASNAGTRREADDALNLEDNGDVPGPVRRADGTTNPSENGADFVDADGGLWDHKVATSEYGPFDAPGYLDKIERGDIANGERIMLNHEGLDPGDLANLLREIESRGLADSFKFWPPL